MSGERDGLPRLVGGHPTLGHWDPTQAPTWIGEELEIQVPTGTTLEYKLVWEHPDGTVSWEPGSNRYVLANRDASRPIVLVPHPAAKE